MSRIYVVKHRETHAVIRYVRANTLNGAVRAVSNEHFEAAATSTDELFQASKAGTFDVLDALSVEEK